jgi:HAD superfamily hydrolase (TIGR01509 family)
MGSATRSVTARGETRQHRVSSLPGHAALSRPGRASDPVQPTMSTSPAVCLDELGARWRIALNSAADALEATTRCGTSLGFEVETLRRLGGNLARERARVAELLEQIAREEHVKLHRPLSAPRASRRMLGLPNDALACLFDLDGLLAGSAAIHAAAWAETFDEFLFRRAERSGERFAPYRPFDPSTEYLQHLHGRPRIAGVHAFLASRGIRLSEGQPDDPPGAETVYGLGNRKNLALMRRLDHEGIAAFTDAHAYLEALREAGLRCAVVSASANTETMLRRAGLEALIDTRIDGNAITSGRLRPLPTPDTLLAACRKLGTPPARTVLFETTLAGIEAGRTAGFLLVVAVERAGQPELYHAHGANLVVSDLGALLDPILAAPTPRQQPRASLLTSA